MSFTLEAPATVEAAIARLQDAGSAPVAALAGGTDLLADIDAGRAAPTRVVSLRNLPWRTLERRGAELRIGSTLPLRALELEPVVRRDFAGLWLALRAVGSVPLRHRATLGGNLGRASPSSDLIPILLAYEATVHLVGPGGERSLPIGAFVRGPRQTDLRPAELIAAVSLPAPAPSTYVWQRVRPANDISQVGVAAVHADGPHPWRIALGGVWPVPTRLTNVERCLTETEPSDAERREAAQLAAADAAFVSDKRATEAYRRQVVSVLVDRAICATVVERRLRE